MCTFKFKTKVHLTANTYYFHLCRIIRIFCRLWIPTKRKDISWPQFCGDGGGGWLDGWWWGWGVFTIQGAAFIEVCSWSAYVKREPSCAVHVCQESYMTENMVHILLRPVWPTWSPHTQARWREKSREEVCIILERQSLSGLVSCFHIYTSAL